jgi:hypothetical protein
VTEFSGLWTTGTTNDGASTYTQAHLSEFFRVLGACMDNEGVAPAYLNALAPSANGANSVRVATGGALVDGKIYYTDANVDTAITSAVGGGNTRIDRLVLRAVWADHTVRVTRIAGTDAASPSAPAITQSAGTTYDIKLAQVLVDTAGTITITDERVFAYPGAMALANSVAYSGVNAAGTAIKPLLTINSSNQVAIITAGAGFKIIDNAQTTVLVEVSEAGALTFAGSGITAANIANRTRKFLLAPTTGENSGVLAITADGGFPMPDGEASTCYARFFVPSDFASGLKVTPVITNASVANGVLNLSLTIRYGAIGETYTNHNDSPAAVDFSAPTINVLALVSTLETTLASVAAADYVALSFVRNGTAGTDTSTNTIRFYGWIVEYTADC